MENSFIKKLFFIGLFAGLIYKSYFYNTKKNDKNNNQNISQNNIENSKGVVTGENADSNIIRKEEKNLRVGTLKEEKINAQNKVNQSVTLNHNEPNKNEKIDSKEKQNAFNFQDNQKGNDSVPNPKQNIENLAKEEIKLEKNDYRNEFYLPNEIINLIKDKKNKEVIFAIEKKGLHIDLTQRGTGKTMIIFSAKENNLELLNYLIEQGADYKLSDEDNTTALHYGTLSGNPKIIERLLKVNLDKNARDAANKRPIDYARKLNFHQLYDLLQ